MTNEPPIKTETLPREFNARAPCRVVSSESNLLGACMRCGAAIGERCGDLAMTERLRS
jgi:hypothetical protein